MPPTEKPIAHVPSDGEDLPGAHVRKQIGEPVGSAPPAGRRVRDVLRNPHYAKVYCLGPHPRGRRRWVAVLTKENPPRLVTDGPEDVEHVDGGEPFLVAPCDECELDRGQRLLSVKLFKQARADGQQEMSLDDVLWRPDLEEGVATDADSS